MTATSAEMAQRIANLFLEEWVGEFAGSVNPTRPMRPPQPLEQKAVVKKKWKRKSLCQERRSTSKVTPDLWAFIRANRLPVVVLQQELQRNWGVSIATATLYKIWNGWSPLAVRRAAETNAG